MFNDKYGLTQAVLDGRKTMTRRVIHSENIPDDPEYGYAPNIDACCVFNEDDVVAKSQYNLCEVVAIAQAYEDVYAHYIQTAQYKKAKDVPEETAGEGNKMFVKAEFMPHHIKITNIEVEHLQDISDEDCLREGVYEKKLKYTPSGYNPNRTYYTCDGVDYYFNNARDAFAALIDKVSGKGTWESNPMVFVYDFELVD